jgi:DNA helicase-2/ATP-dependent DNA helicase PcrA
LGFQRVDKDNITELEREMSARWESLDQNYILYSDMDPHIRNAYIGLWDVHRNIFGYTLLAELTFRAGNLLEDYEINTNDINLLIIDEYQDLNKADIRLIKLLNDRGSRVMAIGDDDQSIYAFRMAAPEGILQFTQEFNNCDDYQLTLSRRCGISIIEAATSMIETVPDRHRKPALRYTEDSKQGNFAYLQFTNEIEEARGVADIVLSRQRSGIPLSEIAILVRSQVKSWADLLLPQFQERNISAIDTEWISSIMSDHYIRTKLAILRLSIDPTDSLSWWTLLKLTRGISQEFRDYVYNEAFRINQRFGPTLLSLAPDFIRAPTIQSSTMTTSLIHYVQNEVEVIDPNNAVLGEFGWADWVMDYIGRDHLCEKSIDLFQKAGKLVPPENGLGYYLCNLEPIFKDLASLSDSVRIMSMTSSKGITVNTCIVMGVEEGIIPHPRSRIAEERRLLYVAMTRATDMCVLTFSHRRKGPTARQGSGNVNHPRGRSPLLEALPIGIYQNGRNYVNSL